MLQLGNMDIDSKDIRELRIFEMGCLRRIMDVTRRDHIKNVDIRALTSQRI